MCHYFLIYHSFHYYNCMLHNDHFDLTKNSMKKKSSSRKKAIGMIIVVTAAFLISFMPYHIQRTIHLIFTQ